MVVLELWEFACSGSEVCVLWPLVKLAVAFMHCDRVVRKRKVMEDEYREGLTL